MFEIKKITMPLELGNYNEAYSGQVVHVWVNIPREIREKRLALMRSYAKALAEHTTGKALHVIDRIPFVRAWKFRKASKEQMAMMGEIWSAGADAETHWSAAEVQTLNDADPALYMWMARESMILVDEFRASKKK